MIRLMVLGCIFFCTWVAAGAQATAQPSQKRCMALWKKGAYETVLGCKARGGERATRSLRGRRYLRVVGTCWDYDVIVQQSCGCRLFKRASICCWRDRPGSCPDFRVGASRVVDCRRYGAPRYGASGNTMNARCVQRAKTAKRQGHCKRAIVKGKAKAFAFFHCRDAVMVHCMKTSQFQPIYRDRCGPGVEGCRGCRVMEECTNARAMRCYRQGFARAMRKRQGRKSRRVHAHATRTIPKTTRVEEHKEPAVQHRKLPKRGLDAGTAANLRSLFLGLSNAASRADASSFQASWHPSGYQRSLSGYGYYAGKAIYRTCKAYRYQILPSLRQAKPAAGGRAWIVPVRYRERGKSYDSGNLYMVAILHGGRWKLLAAHKSDALLKSIAEKWAK